MGRQQWTGSAGQFPLADIARQLRRDVINMVWAAKSGHPGGSLSSTDILTYLFYHEMNLDPQQPDWPDRDRFVLSKGHAAPILYARAFSIRRSCPPCGSRAAVSRAIPITGPCRALR